MNLSLRSKAAVALVGSGRLDISGELKSFLQHLALGLSIVINLLNPKVLFIYGRFLDLEDDAFSRLVQQTSERSLKPIFDHCRIVRIERSLREGAVAAIIQHLTGRFPFEIF